MSTIATHISCHPCGSRVPELALRHGEALRCGLCKSVVKRKRRHGA